MIKCNRELLNFCFLTWALAEVNLILHFCLLHIFIFSLTRRWDQTVPPQTEDNYSNEKMIRPLRMEDICLIVVKIMSQQKIGFLV